MLQKRRHDERLDHARGAHSLIAVYRKATVRGVHGRVDYGNPIAIGTNEWLDSRSHGIIPAGIGGSGIVVDGRLVGPYGLGRRIGYPGALLGVGGLGGRLGAWVHDGGKGRGRGILSPIVRRVLACCAGDRSWRAVRPDNCSTYHENGDGCHDGCAQTQPPVVFEKRTQDVGIEHVFSVPALIVDGQRMCIRKRNASTGYILPANNRSC